MKIFCLLKQLQTNYVDFYSDLARRNVRILLNSDSFGSTTLPATHRVGTVQRLIEDREVLAPPSVSDPDPCGSVSKWCLKGKKS